MANLAQRNIETGRKDLQIASDCIETWDDSDSITAISAQKRFETFTKWWHNHSEARYQGFEINNSHTEVVETELKLNSNIYVEAIITSTHRLVWLIWPMGTSETEGRDLQMHRTI